MAHIMLELMIDRLIIKETPEICDRFYHMLEKVTSRHINMYLNSLDFVKKAGEFVAFFDRFVQHRYLFHYINNEKLIFALNMIFSRIGDQQLTEGDREKLNECIFKIEKNLSTDYTSIFHELEQELSIKV